MTLIGTPGWLSPEAAQQEFVDVRAALNALFSV
jgi:hypothetical protein